MRVRRFPVSRERDPERLRPAVARTCSRRRTRSTDELRLARQRRARRSPALIEHIRAARRRRTISSSSSASGTTTRYHGIRAAAARAILVPTAERDRGDRPVDLRADVPRRARAHVQLVRGARDDPGGLGQRRPCPASSWAWAPRCRTDAIAERFRAELRHPRPLRASTSAASTRTRAARSCSSSFEQYTAQQCGRNLHRSCLMRQRRPAPDPGPPAHPAPRLRARDQDKFDGIAGCEALIMPSYFESLSMVALEAWALGKPVLANGRCDVLQGQCLRSNAGPVLRDYPEFAETLHAHPAEPLARRGAGRERPRVLPRHYAWPVIDAQVRRTCSTQLRDDDRRAARGDRAAAGLVRAAPRHAAAGARGPRRLPDGPCPAPPGRMRPKAPARRAPRWTSRRRAPRQAR